MAGAGATTGVVEASFFGLNFAPHNSLISLAQISGAKILNSPVRAL
jgi:hypothetical protein